ncbi:MAG: shikimate kinase [Terriglobales bacterium]
MPGSRRDNEAPAAECDAPVRAIFLVGFMGAGKTSVGRELSQRLGWRFEDLDDRIQAREGRTIPEIFERSGEAQFRRSELAALRELLAEVESGARLIAALGGGAFVQEKIASLLEEAGSVTVFLDAPADELWRRCGADVVERPLRREEAEFRQLYEARRPRYLRANLRVETSGRAIERVVSEIVSGLRLDRGNSSEEK